MEPQAARVPLLLVETARDEHSDRLGALLPNRTVSRLPPPLGEWMPSRVTEWVDHHHHNLQALSLEAPYAIAGWSFGGVLALELARRLSAEGTAIAHVAMLDSIRPRIRPIRLRDAVPYHLFEAALLPDAATQRSYLRREAKIRVGRRLHQWPPLSRTIMRAQGRQPGATYRPTDPLVRSIHRSYLNYRCAPVDFNVTVFATDASVARSGGDGSLRWSPFLRAGYAAVRIEGGHHSMWEPARLAGLARSIEADLARADNAT